MTDAAYYRDLAAELMRRKWIITLGPLAAGTALVERLHEVGAPNPFLISGFEGIGTLPDPGQADWVVLGTSSTARTMMEEIRAFQKLLDVLPESVTDRVDLWDPDGRAMVLTDGLVANRRVAGRPTWGARRPAWTALEDKMMVDALWDAIGVERAPSLVVGAVGAELTAAARRLDLGSGTVWVGDNKEGWHGGAEYLRYVRSDDDPAEATAFIEAHCDRARVMPFLEGIPCSIHGMVFPTTVLAFRPVEMVVFRVPGSAQLRYASVATFWDPAPDDRRDMRAVARRVGDHLRRTHGYRGAFTVDGVMTTDGFRPTELNPRFATGLAVQVRAADIPLSWINRALVEEENHDYRPDQLERIALDGADRQRSGGGFTPVATDPGETLEAHLLLRNGGWEETTDEESADATLTYGPGPAGGIVRVELNGERITTGPSVAPLVAGGFGIADRLWDTAIGPLQPAIAVR